MILYLKKDGIQLLLLYLGRLIICTPENRYDIKSGARLTFGGKNKKNHKITKIAPFIKYLSKIIFFLLIIGLFWCLNTPDGLFLNTPKAQAASSVQENLDLVKAVVDNFSPLPSSSQSTDDISVSFTPDGFLAKPLVAETSVTKEEKVNKKTILLKKSFTTSQTGVKVASSTSSRSFPFGYCTYYAAQRRFVPWSGNAITWLSGARSFNYATGAIPQPGAIIVTNEGGRTGHVGYVESINGDQITISEMNYRGFGIISSRTISAAYGRILGYIY